MRRGPIVAGWILALGAAAGVRLWNALAGPLMWGYDAWGHVSYVLFLDVYHAVPWADQGWSYFHPPFHYALGWALAQFGSGDVLMRGLALLGSAASLGTAAVAAHLVGKASPGHSGLALLAFGAVAFLPAHLFLSPMPGNELTLTFTTAAAVAVFIGNEGRARPLWLGDALVGVLLGIALLTKFSGLIALGVVLASLAANSLVDGALRGALPRVLARAALIAGIALALAAPYYARNLGAFGNPFQLSRDFALVAEVERDQPPGARHVSDYLRFPVRAFSEPNPLAPHLLRSVWATVYLDVWADVFRESDVERALVAERRQWRSSTVMALVGLLPTALFLYGAAWVVLDVIRGRRRRVYVPVTLLGGASVAAFCVFSWQVPIWSALKASYLLGLSLPFGVSMARGFEQLAARSAPRLRFALGACVAGTWAVAGVLALEGVVHEPRADAPATGAVRFYFGEYEAARAVYGRLVAGAGYKAPWLDNLAAVDLAAGEAERARRLYARAVAVGRPDPLRAGRLAVATAAAGDRPGARALLDDALARATNPELFANRGALSAAAGDFAAAERDLRRAVEAQPEMTAAWLNLAAVLAARGRAEAAAQARRSARRAACAGPRGYPYGVGTGEVLEWGIGRRWLLLWEPPDLRPALPSFYREACARLQAAAEGAAS